jgi:hypothetical protein
VTRLAALAFAVLLGAPTVQGGCTRHADDDAIRIEVQALTLERGEHTMVAADRIARHGRRAIPSIEAALHTADDVGRRNLVLALRKVGDAEAVPLLQHLAAYDSDELVKKESEWTLKTWAQDPATSGDGKARADKAREALRRVDELRHHEEAG